MYRDKPSEPMTDISARADGPDVSVIIPTFNRYESLVEAINSIDYPGAEVIVVDDGSTPPASEFLKGKPHRPFILIRKENGGVSSARNAGMDYATGRYIAFLDSDDQFVPGKLDCLLDSLEAQPNVDFAFHDIARVALTSSGSKETLEKLHSDLYPSMRITAKGSSEVGDETYLLPSLEVFKNLTSGTPIFPSSVVLRRRVTGRIAPWAEGFALCEDMDYFARALLTTDAIYVDKPLTVMGIGEDNLSTDRMKTLYADIAVLKSLSQICPTAAHRNALRESTCRRLQALGWHEKQMGHRNDAAKAYRDSLKYKPSLKSAINYLILLPKTVVERKKLSPRES